jgi:hypothetical protein
MKMSRRPRYIRDAQGLKQLAADALTELHVFVIPPDYWRDYLGNEFDRVISETWSAGYIRVHPDASLLRVREEIAYQLHYDVVPRNFVFLRNVGQSFQQVTSKQEHELQAKYFAPPEAYAPELYIMDATASGHYYVTTPSHMSSTGDDYSTSYRRPTRYVDYNDSSNRSGSSRDNLLSSRTIATQTGEDYYEVNRVYMPRIERRIYRRTGEAEQVWMEIQRLRAEREEMERMREELTEQSRLLHAKFYQQKTFDGSRKTYLDGRDLWKKRYYEEKKKGAPVETKANKLKRELEETHRQIIAQLESATENSKTLQDDDLNDLAETKIYSTKNQFDIDELQFRLQSIKMRLTAETKLRIQAETELRSLKWILAGRRGNASMAQSHSLRAAVLSARRSRSNNNISRLQQQTPSEQLVDLTIKPRYSWATPRQLDSD